MRVSYRRLAFLLLFFVAAIRIAAPQTHILSAIERVEMYTHTCSSLDQDCVQVSDTEINLGKDPTHELNLMSHLLGDLPSLSMVVPPVFLPHLYVPNKSYWHWGHPHTSIFHPPKYS